MAAHLKFVATGIVTAWVLAVACSGGDDRDAPEDPGVLLAPGRTHLSLCVDAGGGREASDDDFAIVQEALDQAIGGLTVVPPEIGEPSLRVGCPPAVEFTGESRTSVDYYQTANVETDEDSLSEHRIFVYFIPEDVFLDAYLGGPFGWEVSELLCEHELVTPNPTELSERGRWPFRDSPRNECDGMTHGLYVPDGADAEDVSAGILRLLGLHERLPQPTVDWQTCVRGTPEPWCVHYDACAGPPPFSEGGYCDEFWVDAGLTRPPPDIDTSAWETYESPFGFDLQYPPGWTVEVVSGNQTRIMDPVYKQSVDDAIAAGHEGTELPAISGMSQFNVIPDIAPGFNIARLMGSCEGDVTQASFRGLNAVYCPGSSTSTDTLTSAGHGYWVEFPPEHTMLIGGSVVSEGTPDLAIIEAILQSFAFTAPP